MEPHYTFSEVVGVEPKTPKSARAGLLRLSLPHQAIHFFDPSVYLVCIGLSIHWANTESSPANHPRIVCANLHAVSFGLAVPTT
jgi:hypothetical protein